LLAKIKTPELVGILVSTSNMASLEMSFAQAQWSAQLSAMRAALAELKLPKENLNIKASSIDELSDFDDDLISDNSGNDVWDFIRDDDGDVSSASWDDGVHSNVHVDDYGTQWLQNKCIELSSRKQGLNADDFQDQISALLASDSAEEELQSALTDMIGFDDLDFVIDLISHRRDIISLPRKANIDPILGKLQTRKQREEALRQRDYEHKHSTLGPSLDRDGPQYPHVYKAHSAGNTLASGGRKYALPVGSERIERERYEEYYIPAGKVGILGAGRKLVQISEMDGLCRRTFKGYKTLNRMQSLVYPVAYKTNENMLICAPTGAVSAPKAINH
jgi:antiviral helicase SLH1